MTDELHLEGEETLDDIFEEDEGVESTHQKGSESERASEKSDAISDDAFLKRVNEIEGRNYKSIEAYQKTVKERHKAFSESGQQKESSQEQKTSYDDEVIEEVALAKYPEAEHVLDQAKDIAAKTGRSLLKVLREESWLIDKAKSISEAKKEEEESKSKINAPSSRIQKETKWDSITPEEVDKLSDEDFEKYSEYMGKKRR